MVGDPLSGDLVRRRSGWSGGGAMAGAEIALRCGLGVRVGCQDRLCVNLDADKALA